MLRALINFLLQLAFQLQLLFLLRLSDQTLNTLLTRVGLLPVDAHLLQLLSSLLQGTLLLINGGIDLLHECLLRLQGANRNPLLSTGCKLLLVLTQIPLQLLNADFSLMDSFLRIRQKAISLLPLALGNRENNL